jgi:hypothetical protein
VKYDGETDTRGWMSVRDFNKASNAAWGDFDTWRDAEGQIIYMLTDAAYDSGFEAGVEAQKNGLGEISPS